MTAFIPHLNSGDTRQQVLSRRAFLEAGFYAPISDALNQAALDYGAQGEILDVGCGEGYYSARLAAAVGAPLTGLDISKEAVRCAAGQYKACAWLCATAAHIPVPDDSVGTLCSLFALTLAIVLASVLFERGFLHALAWLTDRIEGC